MLSAASGTSVTRDILNYRRIQISVGLQLGSSPARVSQSRGKARIEDLQIKFHSIDQ